MMKLIHKAESPQPKVIFFQDIPIGELFVFCEDYDGTNNQEIYQKTGVESFFNHYTKKLIQQSMSKYRCYLVEGELTYKVIK
jgi:hypothetical protein